MPKARGFHGAYSMMTAECEDGWPSVCEMNFCGDFAERKEVA